MYPQIYKDVAHMQRRMSKVLRYSISYLHGCATPNTNILDLFIRGQPYLIPSGSLFLLNTTSYPYEEVALSLGCRSPFTTVRRVVWVFPTSLPKFPQLFMY